MTVDATPDAWAGFLTTPREARRLPRKDMHLQAARKEARKFAKAFAEDLSSS